MNNSLPPWICVTCKKQLRRAYKFQKKCNKSLKTFIHYLSLLKCGTDENNAQQILNVQMTDVLYDNDDEKKKKCGDDKNDVQEPSKSDDSSEDNANDAIMAEICSKQSDNPWNSNAFSDFTSDFICDVKEKFKSEQDSDAYSESTVILNLNSIENGSDVLNNKEDDLIGISGRDITINELFDSQNEQSNYVNSFANNSSDNKLQSESISDSVNELDKHLNSVIDNIQEISMDLNSVLKTTATNDKIENAESTHILDVNSDANKSNNNINILSNNQSDNVSDTFRSEVISKESNMDLDFTTNVNFNTNIILHHDANNSEILSSRVTNKSENSELNTVGTTRNTPLTVKDEISFENSTLEVNEERKYICQLDLTSNENRNNPIPLNTDQIKTENETTFRIKIENDNTSDLPENDKYVKSVCTINSTSNSTELNEEQKFVFELDFTRECNFNTDLPTDIKTENVSINDCDNFDNVEDLDRTELLVIEKEESKISLNNEQTEILNSENTSNLVCSTYENVQDMLTIEKTELPTLKTEVHSDFTSEDTTNISDINNFKHISVKTADTINSTIMSQSSIENSGSNSVLTNQLLHNGNVDLNNSRLTNKNTSQFSIFNLLNSSTNLQEQNTRFINLASNTDEVNTNKQCINNDLIVISDDDSSDRVTMPLKRRKISLSENRNSIYNYSEANTEIASKSVYNGSVYGAQNSAEYIDMEEHMANNFNSMRNYIQPPLTAVQTHNYFKPSSHNTYKTNYFGRNSNPAHSFKANHNSYTYASNIQSTVSNINRNTFTSNMYQNIYSPNMSSYQTSNSTPSCNTNNQYNERFNATPYQTINHNPNFPIGTNSITRNDYVAQHNTNQQYAAHYRNLPPKNLLFHPVTALNPECNTTNLHRDISSSSCNGARLMSTENKDPSTERIVNSLQNSTTVIPQLQNESTLNETPCNTNAIQPATNERQEKCSDQKDFVDENIDNNRPASRTSQISSNSQAESTDSTVTNHFYTFFTNMETASAYLHTPVEGVVENEADELMFLVDKNKSVYTCKKCCHHFPCISELYIHSEEHIDEFDYQTMIYRIRDHTAQSDCISFVIIEDIKLFVCGKCDVEFTDKLLLFAHVRRHVPNVIVIDVNRLVCQCQNCIAFSSQNTGTDFKCGKCDKTFLNAENLRVHGFIHFLEKPAKCAICNRNFQGKARLHDHNLRMHTPKLECEVCKKLIRPDIFDNHQLMHQNPNNECDICGKRYPTRPRLLIHTRIHSDDKPYACTYCDKKFLMKLVLENHERVHTGEKPYECEVCKKCFSQRTSVQVHMRIHTGEKPYKCKDCGKCYTQSYVYKQHRKKHHPTPSSP